MKEAERCHSVEEVLNLGRPIWVTYDCDNYYVKLRDDSRTVNTGLWVLVSMGVAEDLNVLHRVPFR